MNCELQVQKKNKSEDRCQKMGRRERKEEKQGEKVQRKTSKLTAYLNIKSENYKIEKRKCNAFVK